ncbi:MAG: protein translocase subunit SecD [Anaerolineae bacterium CG_4_9_14_3_um_filter_57_17]|nr:protein translocase subunit SecD [bacterium]NCT21581.1 protein translocase subunit SecD [bacterium]PJB67762.1 MAG: protein translocase subunit SecD [Anaerolineae bacterium CG_4_9_14_3_um_filter_57_17]
MIRNRTPKLVLIVVVLALSIWISLVDKITILNPFNQSILIDRNVAPHLGLDLRGGLQVLMEADLPATTKVDAGSMETARTILENRTNALGVAETTLQVAGDRRIVGEFPNAEDPEAVIASLKQTGLLEFVNTGDQQMAPGTTIQTDFGLEPGFVPTPDPSATPGPDGTIPAPVVYHTVMTGKELQTVGVTTTQSGGYQIAFTLKSDGSKIFADYTTQNTQKYLTIVLDHKVISSPQIQTPITDGSGVITGSYTRDEANAFVVQLRYGSLPIPIKVVESRAIGPTLGAESVKKSVTAGAIGLIVVMLFMALYYRLPGIVADLALITYALISYALFKSIPVTLTLPGIAGFILSIGMAVDANVLIFERLKEELRSGKTLLQAIDLGWSRAWTSIRDSNISTLITCFILYFFGNAFGASIVKGFSVTLALGVIVSLFTAITVTSTYLHLILDNVKAAEHPKWFGM